MDTQGLVTDVEAVLVKQFDCMLNVNPPPTTPAGVQYSMDSAGWHKQPSNKLCRNFTSGLVKPLMNRLPKAQSAARTGAAHRPKVGDAMNSPHNNKLAWLYHADRAAPTRQGAHGADTPCWCAAKQAHHCDP
mmetsp:Transcript_33216/g.83732  ORF Transcript_33216/g.83732 Transcript_33216/m.83732 type:complete len:132 (-) Transcript_33216:978-1373(-)